MDCSTSFSLGGIFEMMKANRIAIVIAGLAFSNCAGLKLAEPLKPKENDWATFGKTSSRINATNEIVAPPLQLAWEHDITSAMGYGSPVIIDSTVFVANLRGELYGISVSTGKRLGWVTVGEAIQGSPIIEGNVAYIAAANTRESLIAYDLLQGKVLWKQEFGDIEVTPLLYRGKIYFGNTAGMFFCVNRINGEMEWKYRLSENTKRKGIRSSATAHDSLVIFGTEDGSVYALDATYGSERWSYNTGAPIFASLAVNAGVVYCGNMDGNLYALNAGNGAVVWKFSAGSSLYATPSFSGGILLIGTTGGKLFGVNVSDGTNVWTTDLNSVVNSSAVISGTVAYVGTLKKELVAIKVDDGTVVWRQTLKGRVKTSPAIAQGKVIIATDDKMILAFKSMQPK